jgi:hypothetical protein
MKTHFFHQYAVHRKKINAIWKINKNDDSVASSFQDIASVGIDHFNEI